MPACRDRAGRWPARRPARAGPARRRSRAPACAAGCAPRSPTPGWPWPPGPWRAATSRSAPRWPRAWQRELGLATGRRCWPPRARWTTCGCSTGGRRRPGLLPGRRGGRPRTAAARRPAAAAGAGPDLRRRGARRGAGRLADPHAGRAARRPGLGRRPGLRASTSSPTAARRGRAGARPGPAGGAAGHRRVGGRAGAPARSTPSSGPAALPTQGIEPLAGQLPIRLLDLSDVVGAVRDPAPGVRAGHGPGRHLRHPAAR